MEEVVIEENEEEWDIIRDKEGYIKKIIIHRKKKMVRKYEKKS